MEQQVVRAFARTLWLVIALVLPGPGGVAAQSAPPGIPSISVDVNLVVLHPSVRDRQGGFVSGLRKQDFQVFEDGRRQAIRLFQHEDVPVSVGLLVDNSASMGPKRPDVTAAALAFARSSNPQDELFVVNFDQKVSFGLPDTELFSARAPELEKALNGVPAWGQTALYDAIEAGLEHMTKASRERKILIVVSDGGDNSSRQTLKQVVDNAARSNVMIYAIGLLDEHDADQNPGFLKKIARVTGGEAFFPDPTSEAVNVCKQIAQDIRRQYTIGYAPSNEKLDSTYRRIRVVVHAPGRGRLEVRSRAGYIAAPPAARPAPGIQ